MRKLWYWLAVMMAGILAALDDAEKEFDADL